MRTKRLDFTYKPLSASSYIETVGSIPNKQSYDSSTGMYEPDYTLDGSHLILQAHVGIYDANNIITNGDAINSEYLTNIVWKEILTINNETTTTVITTSSTNYILDSTKKGRIEMKRNVPMNGKIVLEFNAEYYDVRTAEVLEVRQTLPVELGVSSSPATIILDKPNTNIWNPFRDPKVMTFNAVVRLGEEDVPSASRTLVWEKQRSDGSYTAIGSDDTDFGYTVSSDGKTFTQDMDFIGDMVNMRVRVATLNGNTITDGLLTEYFSMKFRLPAFQYDFIETPDNVEPDTEHIYPKVIVTDRNGRVENAEEYLTAEWYTGAGTASGSPTMALVATGFTPKISTSKVNANGMVLGLELKQTRNWKIVTQDDATVLHNGSVVIVK